MNKRYSHGFLHLNFCAVSVFCHEIFDIYYNILTLNIGERLKEGKKVLQKIFLRFNSSKTI